jgi:hypothetical protein
VQIALPTKDVDQLIIKAGPVETDFGTTLLSVNEKASWDQSIADYGGSEGAGFLFSISRLTRAQYESYIAGGRDGQQAFAVEGKAADERFTAPVAETYYIYGTATDVQFYRTGGEIDTNSQDWKSWESLMDMGASVRTDMIARNGLTAYGDEEFLNQEFTWTGDHAYVKFYPYYAVDGSTAEYDTLVLSQPARQGQGGIWCAERWYDPYGNCGIWFPGVSGTGDSGMTAKDYFAKLQKAADAGDTAYLTPLDAAKKLTPEIIGAATAPTAGSFAVTDKLDKEYGACNSAVSQYVASLLSGGTDNPDAIVEYAGRFTPDTWGVLGRNEYGSDWWPALLKALETAAVGKNQDVRDRNMIRLYLSYTGSTAAISQGLGGVLRRQDQADARTFAAAVTGCTAAEQTRVRQALDQKA